MLHSRAEHMDIRLFSGPKAECELSCRAPASALIGVQSDSVSIQENHFVAEMAVHVGPVIWNGILGCHFCPRRSDSVAVRVCHQRVPGRIVPWALVSPTEAVRTGLYKEWAVEILEQAVQTAQELELAAGDLTFSEAAYGEVGGDVRVFRALARVLVCALVTKPSGRDAAWLRTTAMASLQLV